MMDYSITWGGDPEDVCLTTRGVVQMRDLEAMMGEAFADPRWVEGMKVLFDQTQADWTELTASALEDWADAIKRMGPEIGFQQIAAVLRDDASYRAARNVGLLLDWHVPWMAQLFTSIPQAREWLRQPAEETFAQVMPRPLAEKMLESSTWVHEVARELREEAQALRAETRERRRRSMTSGIKREVARVARELRKLDASLDVPVESNESLDDLDARTTAVEARISRIEKLRRRLRFLLLPAC
jgi:hypothetical protein